MRLDHIAFRTSHRDKTAAFFIEAFGYRIQRPFELKFPDGTTAKCVALEPPEKPPLEAPWIHGMDHLVPGGTVVQYHMAPEIFVSDGPPGSIVGDWVEARGGVGGIHHLAYMVDDVQAKMEEWRDKGYAEFSSDQPLTCPGLTQVFTKPSLLTGVVFEFIARGAHGFCEENVANLMQSSKGDDALLKLKADHAGAEVRPA